jgi:hypothetical protein
MRVLYVEGDPCSPKYVRGALRLAGADVTTLVRESPGDAVDGFDLAILSDATADRLGDATLRALAARVERGLGLLMVGGWTSFGRGGFVGSPLEGVLPVAMTDGDDRIAWPSGAYLVPSGQHEITDGLPWEEPPVVTGANDVKPKEGASVVLNARAVVAVDVHAARFHGDLYPVLVVGALGRGRVAALATDLAPHWSGGWTDWGGGNLDVQEGGEQVGRGYARFVAQLAAWVAQAPAIEARGTPR